MSRSSGAVAVCTAAAAAVVLVATATPATAAPVAPVLLAFHGGPTPTIGAAAAAPSAVAGYLPNVSRSRQTVSAKVRVPAITCTADSMVATFVGLGSTSATGGFVAGYLESGCRGTVPYYRAAVVDRNGPIGPVVTVAAGDLLSIAARAGRSPQATLTDLTSKQVSTGVTAAFVADLAQFTVQAIGSPFPTFTRYGFAGAKVGTSLLQTLAPARIDQVSSARKVQLRTSAITSTGGFTVKYVSQG